MVRRHPQMPTVADRDHVHPYVYRLLNGNIHRFWRDNDAQAPIGVDIGGRRGLSHDAPIGARVDAAIVVAVDVRPQHVGHAMRLDPTHVGLHQDICRQVAIVLGHPHFSEHRGDGFAQGTFLHFDCQVLRDFK